MNFMNFTNFMNCPNFLNFTNFMNFMNSSPKRNICSPSEHAAKEKPWRNPSRYYFLLLVLILAVTSLVYSGSMKYPVLNFDDIDYFHNYPEITMLNWHNTVLYFTRHYLLVYQPLPVLSFALNYYLTGTAPIPIHLVSLAFHLVNIVLVFRLFSALFQKKYFALGIAAIFAIHPLNVESVVWISARSSVMFTCFYLAGLICYMNYLDRNLKLKYLVFAFLFFIFSLFSKPQAVTFPAVLLLMDFLKQRKIMSGRIWFEKFPFILLSLVFVMISFTDRETMMNVTQWKLFAYPPMDVFLLLAGSIDFYMVKAFLPVNLCCMYMFPVRDLPWLPWYYYASPLILAFFAYLSWRFRKNRLQLFGILLFLVTILPNLPVFSARQVIVADRYAYFPVLGILVFFFGLISELQQTGPRILKYFPRFLLITLFLIIIAFSFQSFERTKVWKNESALMTDIIKKNQESPFLSKFFRKRADYYVTAGELDKAITDYSSAMRINPRDIQSYVYQENVYMRKNEMKNALYDLDQAIRLDPHIALFYSNRACVKLHLHDFEGSLSDCNTCMALDSCIPDVYNILAIIDYQKKDTNGCIKNLTKAIELKPEYAEAYKNRGKVLISLGREKEAFRDFKRAVILGDPESEELLKNLKQKIRMSSICFHHHIRD